MGRTPAKIEHGVRCCASANIDKCTGCPYAGLHVGIGCKTILFRDVQDYLKEIKISAARIEDMTKQLESAQPKWISVEERLPSGANGMDFCVNVVVYTQDKQVTTGWCNGEIWYLLNWDNDFISKHPSEYVTHWMPLPEPPKEE